jgi:hypothetical protein
MLGQVAASKLQWGRVRVNTEMPAPAMAAVTFASLQWGLFG